MKKLLFLYFGVGFFLFLNIFYHSFYEAQEFSFFTYTLTPLGLLLLFYLFSVTLIFFMRKSSMLYFKAKETLFASTFVHFSLSLSLVLCMQYTEFFLFQFAYLLFIVRYENTRAIVLFSLLYLTFVHHSLLQLFISEFVFLYFINLFLLSYLLYRVDLGIRKGDVLACGIFFLLLLFMWNISEAFRYSLYVWLDIVDVQNDASPVVVFALTILHSSLLFFIEFKKK